MSDTRQVFIASTFNGTDCTHVRVLSTMICNEVRSLVTIHTLMNTYRPYYVAITDRPCHAYFIV